jgi:catechol 2,3-dioxygenase-like lactoylglutathione lyase family enzyme
MAAPGLHHVALRVADCEASARFYSGLLGLPEIRRRAEGGQVAAIWLLAGPTILMLERALRGCGADQGSAHLLALAVDDLAIWVDRLERQGLAVDDRTAHTLYVRDPDGHRVGLTVYPSLP